jgi:hypothetical protein
VNARLLFCALFVFSLNAWPWGYEGHRRLASMMHEPLPSNLCLRAWIQSKQNYTNQNMACDADRNRVSGNPNYDPNEAPRHYLGIDYLKPIESYPRDFSAATAQLGINATRNGLVPWRAEDLYQQLVTDFASRDETKIVRTMFFMSHYIADSFSVLHNTKDFDPNGLHGRWESDMLALPGNLNALTDAARGYFGTPGKMNVRNNIFEVVLAGNPLVPQLIQFDVASGGDEQKLFDLSKDLTARRWGDATTLLASVAWSAWAEAGSPELSGFTASCSKIAPNGPPVVRGYPPPNGFTSSDAGVRDGGGSVSGELDASVSGLDAGELDAGIIKNDAGTPDGGVTTSNLVDTNRGCHCSSGFSMAALLGLVWRRRRAA